ncbi:MAG TPA: PPOX class F420-dependent oxidoreductase [Micromonosporaceae bacterium]
MPEKAGWDRYLSLLSSKGRGVVATLKADGRPQLSNVDFCYNAESRLVRLSTTDGRAKVRNLHRDPRVSLHLSTPDLSSYAVYEGVAEISEVAAKPDDTTVAELIDVFREVQGEHPDWNEYRAAMVADRRLVVRFHIDYAYGWIRP